SGRRWRRTRRRAAACCRRPPGPRTVPGGRRGRRPESGPWRGRGRSGRNTAPVGCRASPVWAGQWRHAVVLTASTGSLASRAANRFTMSGSVARPWTVGGVSGREKYTPSSARPRRRKTATEWLVSPLASVVSNEKASRSTDATWGQPASGAGPKCVVTLGSPTGLSTGPDGQAAATFRSSLKAAVVPAPLEYSTASVDSTVLPCPSTAATCRRAVRMDSLGYVPLHRSSVGCVSPLPPWRPATVRAGATSESATTSRASSGADGSFDPAGALGLGVSGFRPDDTVVGLDEPPARSWAVAASTTTTPTAPAIRRARRQGRWSAIGLWTVG